METTAPPPSRHASSKLGPRLYGMLAAIAAVAALTGWFMLYPLDRWAAAILLGGYGLIVALRPALWLVLMPALWPVVDLAPWSGHIHFTESDALALATLAALGLREALAPPPSTLAGRAPVKLTVSALALFGLLAASVLISGIRGLGPQPVFDAAALVGYNTPLNALRVGKGFVLAFALIPFLHLAIRRDGQAGLDRLTIGLTLGLTTCSLAALWERLAFPGLTDFAADYRTTALFWESHVGGAGLDAWLLLSMPFAVLLLQQTRQTAGKILALLLVGIGSYALFSTLSRIVYGALAVAVVTGGGLLLLRPARPTEVPRRTLVLAALLAATLLAAALIFREGGYRGLLAFFGLALLVYPGGDALSGMRTGLLASSLLVGALLLILTGLAAIWLPKGVYLVYALSWAATALAIAAHARSKTAAAGSLVASLLAWTALNTICISASWHPEHHFTITATAIAAVLGLMVWQSRAPLWQPQPADLFSLAASLALGGFLVATLGSYYMSSSFSAAGTEQDVRMTQIERSIDLPRTSADKLFGIGLGRYPSAYFWSIEDPIAPGTLSLLEDAEGYFMRLGSARGRRGADEWLGLSQRIPYSTEGRLVFRFRARSAANAMLIVNVCRKHLLYPENCLTVTRDVKGGAGWQTFEGVWPEAFRGPGGLPRLAMFSIGMPGVGPVDVDDLEVMDSHMRPLLRNGNFAQGGDFWFFGSDRYHLPWHAHNMFAHTYVEQGLFGLAVLTLSLALAGWHLLRSARRGSTLAPTLAAALAGASVVGTVDSLLDIPRLTLFFTLLLWLALTVRHTGQAGPPSSR